MPRPMCLCVCVLCLVCGVVLVLRRVGTMLPQTIVLMIVLCSCGCLVIGAVLSLVVLKARLRRQKKKDKSREVVSRATMRSMRHLTLNEHETTWTAVLTWHAWQGGSRRCSS